MSIISHDDSCGGLQHAPAAFESNPDMSYGIVNRVSSYGQAGNGKLNAKDFALVSATQTMAPGRLRFIVSDVERGGVDNPRPVLEQAIWLARWHDVILFAHDWTRLFRPAAFYRGRKDAYPAPQDWDWFRKRTRGIVVATLMPPTASAEECRIAASKLAGRGGRPRSIGKGQEQEFIHDFDTLSPTEVARKYGCGERTVFRKAQWLGLTKRY